LRLVTPPLDLMASHSALGVMQALFAGVTPVFFNASYLVLPPKRDAVADVIQVHREVKDARPINLKQLGQ
jgi:hypothetical protein